MELTYVTLAVLTVVIGFQGYLLQRTLSKHERAVSGLLTQSQYERKDLLDRIQSPTFDHYANKVMREKVIDKPKEPEEERPEFVS